MHEKGIQHRDIKVENILLQQKSFKLCDFGSASKSILDPSQHSSQALEEHMEEFEKYTTMMYSPPEMIDRYLKYKVDTQCDVWMLGCVIFSLCFFMHPFQDVQKIGILNAQYFMPKDERISEKMRDLICVILVPNPADRPTIEQLLTIL